MATSSITICVDGGGGQGGYLISQNQACLFKSFSSMGKLGMHVLVMASIPADRRLVTVESVVVLPAILVARDHRRCVHKLF